VRELKKTYKAASRTGDAEAVHDLRVATRRLQTILDLATVADAKNDVERLKKKLKKLRHVLSVKRDTDVLAQTMRSRAAGAASAARRSLWDQAARETRAEGEKAAGESQRWLRKQKMSKFTARIMKIVSSRVNNGFSSRDLYPAVRRIQQKWKQAVRQGSSGGDSSGIHNARIKIKGLRYMLELVSEIIETGQTKDLIEWLKGAQDELGEWRDQTELCRRLTAVLSQDAGLQSNPVATAMIDAARRRTQLYDEHARHMVAAMRKSEAQKRILVLPGPDNPRMEVNARSK
jgi:CHAD domain-containing protein